jgi:hypothetical protein
MNEIWDVLYYDEIMTALIILLESSSKGYFSRRNVVRLREEVIHYRIIAEKLGNRERDPTILARLRFYLYIRRYGRLELGLLKLISLIVAPVPYYSKSLDNRHRMTRKAT